MNPTPSTDIDVRGSDMAQPSVLVGTSVLAPTDLVPLDTRGFYRAVGDVNTAYTTALTAFEAAQANLTVMVTEQVARLVLDVHPAAAMVFARVAAEYHQTDAGTRAPGCEGHDHRLVPFEVLDGDGVVLGGFDPLSPVMFLMERLSPLLGLEDQILDIETREWALDCAQD